MFFAWWMRVSQSSVKENSSNGGTTSTSLHNTSPARSCVGDGELLGLKKFAPNHVSSAVRPTDGWCAFETGRHVQIRADTSMPSGKRSREGRNGGSSSEREVRQRRQNIAIHRRMNQTDRALKVSFLVSQDIRACISAKTKIATYTDASAQPAATSTSRLHTSSIWGAGPASSSNVTSRRARCG